MAPSHSSRTVGSLAELADARSWVGRIIDGLGVRCDDAALASGMSLRSIAGELGCSPGSVLRALKAAGIPVRTAPSYPLLRDARWLRGRYVERGMSSSVIARELGCSVQSVLNALERFGIERRSRPLVSDDRLLTDWRLFGRVHVVARLNGIAADTVLLRLAELGVFPDGAHRLSKARLRSACEAGGSVSTIARRVGRNYLQVRVELLRHQLTPPA